MKLKNIYVRNMSLNKNYKYKNVLLFIKFNKIIFSSLFYNEIIKYI